MRCDDDYSIERYEDAIEIFFNQFQNGEVRIGARRPDYPQKKKSQKVDEKAVPSMTSLNEEIVLSDYDEIVDTEADERSSCLVMFCIETVLHTTPV